MGKLRQPLVFKSLIAVILIILLGHPFTAMAQTSVNLILNDVEIETGSDQGSFNVEIALSLHDSSGNPIKDATGDDFELLEDNQEKALESVKLVDDEPINVALLIDTSNSMVGNKMEAAQEAASKFLENLQIGDKTAVLTFDNAAVHRIDFTSDFAAAREEVELITPTEGGGTCLYDAAYEALELTSALPHGRRALIVLTDGKDEAGGQPCSAHSLEEVLGKAEEGNSPIPLYTIGLGNAADTIALQKMANETGGRYLNSPNPNQLKALFGRLSDELRSQYVLEFISNVDAGEHSLIIKVNYFNALDEFNLKVDFPERPYGLSFISPQGGAEVSAKTTVSVKVTGSGAPIQQVVFLVNNTNIGAASTEPYQIEWDPAGLKDGQVFLEAVARDANGNQLARNGINLYYRFTEIPTSAIPAETAVPQSGVLNIKGIPLTNTTVISIGGVLIVIVIALVGYNLFKKRSKKEPEENANEMEPVRRIEKKDETVEAVEHTMDAIMPGSGVYGALVVEESDDPSMNGHRFEMTRPVTTLGRKSVNDIMFPKDSPVSRQHAVIEAHDGKIYLNEVLAEDEQGGIKRPSFGTFVNGKAVDAPVALKNGDEIRLGKRLRLRIICAEPPCEDEEPTREKSPNDQSTIEAYRR